jgi:S1-C subfamily serine protease
MNKLPILLLVLAFSMVLIGCTGVLSDPWANISGVPATTPSGSGFRSDTASLSGQTSFADLFDAVNPGVVAVRAFSSQSSLLGSGFVVDASGRILTNEHVVAGATDIEVDFPSGKMVRGTVIAQDPDSDLAVIKVDLPSADLHPLVLGDSSKVRVGDLVVAIGNPFGLDSTMTLGIVSAKGRTMDSQRAAPDGSGDFLAATDLIQTDAAVNSGNSGGPLLNLKGEVIGMNRAIVSNAASSGAAVNSGVGLAVSSNVIRHVLPSLIANGKYDYSYLGIKALPQLLLVFQEDLGLPYNHGIYILEAVSGSPAALGGLRGATGQAGTTGIPRGGDLIIKLNGVDVFGFPDLNSYLFYSTVPGDTVVITVFRDGKTVEVPVILGKRS